MSKMPRSSNYIFFLPLVPLHLSIMILKFSTPDLFQSPLVDVDTGELVYNVTTEHDAGDQDKLRVLLNDTLWKTISKIIWTKPDPSLLFNFQRLNNVSAIIDQDGVQEIEVAFE